MLQSIEHAFIHATGATVWFLMVGIVLCVLASSVVIGWLGLRLFRKSNLLLAGVGFVVLILDLFWTFYLAWCVALSLLIYLWLNHL
jgi:hypothetical protein